ncbi:hypothetical protein EW146_g9945 [Bondarzewia mesenterica]|uniref:Uncharacterized protein n=1 Tax=Bondarzewia mesenterica TaxID=1095465 RepID=A0A4S4L209_9AGAM|nr:hypothetical protein EW146_g9945 [Bondarzewia mesenterica]
MAIAIDDATSTVTTAVYLYNLTTGVWTLRNTFSSAVKHLQQRCETPPAALRLRNTFSATWQAMSYNFPNSSGMDFDSSVIGRNYDEAFQCVVHDGMTLLTLLAHTMSLPHLGSHRIVCSITPGQPTLATEARSFINSADNDVPELEDVSDSESKYSDDTDAESSTDDLSDASKISGCEIAALLPRKTVSVKSKKQAEACPAARAAAVAAAETIADAQGTKKRKRVQKKKDADSGPVARAALSGSRSQELTSTASSDTLILSTKASSTPRPPIYQFFELTSTNLSGETDNAGDKHYCCRFGDKRIMTITKSMKGSSNGLVNHLKKSFSQMYTLHEVLKHCTAARPLSAVELMVAQGLKSPNTLSYSLDEPVEVILIKTGRKQADIQIGLESCVSLSLDAWTSQNGYAFLAIVMHYVTNDWQLEEILIDFREIIGEHSGENLAACVWTTMEFYGLVGKLLETVGSEAAALNTADSKSARQNYQEDVAAPINSQRDNELAMQQDEVEDDYVAIISMQLISFTLDMIR